LYFNPVVRYRWSLIAGGAGLVIVLTVALLSAVMALARRFRRLPRHATRARQPVTVLAVTGLIAAASYFCFSPGGPFFGSTVLRIVFTVACLAIVASTMVLAWRRSLIVIPAAAITYWVQVEIHCAVPHDLRPRGYLRESPRNLAGISRMVLGGHQLLRLTRRTGLCCLSARCRASSSVSTFLTRR
jgi:hypothetical protein